MRGDKRHSSGKGNVLELPEMHLRNSRRYLSMALLGFTVALLSQKALSADKPQVTVFQDNAVSCSWDVDELLRKKLATELPIDPLKDFSRVFALMTGHEMGAPAPKMVRLRLELLPSGDPLSPLKDLPVGFRETASEIAVMEDVVTLRAESIQGLSGGLYKILEDWGCRWIYPGDLGEVIPTRDHLSLELGTRLVTIGSDTGFGAHRAEASVWIQRNRLLPATWLPGFHYWLHGVEADTYFASHPEYYALVDNHRTPTQPESTNTDVIKLKIEDAKQFFRKNPSARSYPMDPQDNTSFSEAPEATAIDPTGTGPDGLPYVTDRVVQFANAVLQGFQDEFPGKTVALYSYLNHSLPPERVILDPRIAIGVTRFGYCNLRLAPTATTTSPQKFEDLVSAWLRLTPNVYDYEYNPPPWAALLPFPNYLVTAESMRRLHRLGVKGFYSDGQFTEFAPGVFLNSYVRHRMMVDPEQDPQALMKDYCDSFFGPAAAAMQKYYDILSEVVNYNNPARPAIGVSIYGFEELFPRSVVSRASDQLEAALGTAGLSELQRKRLEWIKLGQDYLSTFLAAVDAAKARDASLANKLFEKVFKLTALQERASHGVLKMDDARLRLEAVKSTLFATYFPLPQGMTTRWQLLGPIPRKDVSEEEAKAILSAGPADKKVSFGSVQYSWQPYTAESGLLDLNKVFARTALPPLSKAFAAVVVTAESTMDVHAFFGSFYPFSLYLNGKKIFERTYVNFNSPTSNNMTVALQKGENRFVFLSDEQARSTAENAASDGTDWSISLALQDKQVNPLSLHGMH